MATSSRLIKWLDDPNKLINQTVYWNTNEARNAMEQYHERIAGGQSADQPIPEEIREHLPLVDVETVYCLYCDNLKQFFDRAEPRVGNDEWVSSWTACSNTTATTRRRTTRKVGSIEIRGTSWQKDGRKFIIDSLVHNLTYFAAQDSSGLRSGATAGAGVADHGRWQKGAGRSDHRSDQSRILLQLSNRSRSEARHICWIWQDILAAARRKRRRRSRWRTGRESHRESRGHGCSGRDGWKPLLGSGSGSGGTGGSGGNGPTTTLGGGGRGGKPAPGESSSTNHRSNRPRGRRNRSYSR